MTKFAMIKTPTKIHDQNWTWISFLTKLDIRILKINSSLVSNGVSLKFCGSKYFNLLKSYCMFKFRPKFSWEFNHRKLGQLWRSWENQFGGYWKHRPIGKLEEKFKFEQTLCCMLKVSYFLMLIFRFFSWKIYQETFLFKTIVNYSI